MAGSRLSDIYTAIQDAENQSAEGFAIQRANLDELTQAIQDINLQARAMS